MRMPSEPAPGDRADAAHRGQGLGCQGSLSLKRRFLGWAAGMCVHGQDPCAKHLQNTQREREMFLIFDSDFAFSLQAGNCQAMKLQTDGLHFHFFKVLYLSSLLLFVSYLLQ